MAVSVLYLFLAVPWVGLWSVIVAFPGHTPFLFTAPWQTFSKIKCFHERFCSIFFFKSVLKMGRNVRNSAFRVSDKVRFKPVCSASAGLENSTHSLAMESGKSR